MMSDMGQKGYRCGPGFWPLPLPGRVPSWTHHVCVRVEPEKVFNQEKGKGEGQAAWSGVWGLAIPAPESGGLT